MSSQVAGLSGEFYEAWVELPPQKIHISQVDFRDRAAAIVTLDDGRQLRVELTGMSGALATSFDEQGLPVPTICIDINDPSLASMSPEELRQRLQLVPDPFCWRRHWDDAALLALAQEEAHRQASLYLDTVPDGLELPANMSPQLKRETVLHHVAKSILQEERRVAVPQVDAEVRIPTPGSNKGMEVHESWAMPDLMMMLDHVSLEEPFENLIPDVTCKAWPQEGGRVEWPFLIEITVTNDIDYERLERIRAVRCGALEINLGLAGGRVTREELKQLIVVELATKRWLFHPEMEEWLSDAKGRLQNQWASEQQAIEMRASWAAEHRRKVLATPLGDVVNEYLEAVMVMHDEDVTAANASIDGWAPQGGTTAQRAAMERVAETTEKMSIHGFPEAADSNLLSSNGLIARLLSIQLGRPVGYRLANVMGVLNAIKQTKGVERTMFSVYMIAVRIYKPQLSEAQQNWFDKWAEEVREGIRQGDQSFMREPFYDRILSLLFPAMAEALSRPMGKRKIIDAITWDIAQQKFRRHDAPTRSMARFVEHQPRADQVTGLLLDTKEGDWWLRGNDLDAWKKSNPDAARAWFKDADK
jgi:hypothetical protein